jgi:hypothetical protein
MTGSGGALPLAGLGVAAASWPAAAEAGRLLALLGATVTAGDDPHVALRHGDRLVSAEPGDAATDWEHSGLAAVSGRPTGSPATVARAAALAFELLSALTGPPVRVDGPAILAHRLAFLPGRRAGTTSLGGAARLLRAADGWWALNLARPSDQELLPALVEAQVSGDPWAAVERWSAAAKVADVIDRAVLLGLPAARVAETTTPGSPWDIALRPARPRGIRPIRVVNLGALWAAPLAAHLLSLAGAEVVDVEDGHRPDAARTGMPSFYQALHAGSTLCRLDFRSADGREELRRRLADADVVIEASRPRALVELGGPAEVIQRDDRPRVWVRITGHGPAQPHRVAFGDDAAAAGGLVAWDGSRPAFVGDAVADPLTGLLAAVAATALLRAGVSAVVDLSLSGSAAWATQL